MKQVCFAICLWFLIIVIDLLAFNDSLILFTDLNIM